MRIALLAPLVSPISPPYLGGAQVLLHDLAAGLASRGHEVTLYAAPGSAVPGIEMRAVPLDAIAPRPARFAEGPGANNAAIPTSDPEHDPALQAANAAFARVYELIAAHAGEHDLLHAHAYDWAAYAYSSHQPLPVVHTLHLPPLDPSIRQVLGAIAPVSRSAAQATLVAVSQAGAHSYSPYCAISRVIYNGIDAKRIPFGATPAPDPYVLFAGRISPEKGVEDALRIAALTGNRLLLAGGIYDAEYYMRHVAPMLGRAGSMARFVGAVDREQLWALMAGARAVLCPIGWEEPFGLVACEAQAAGAPVVGYARGALPEVVASGMTGVLVMPGDVQAAARGVAAAMDLDRRACRTHVERQFSLAAMLDAYEACYAGVLTSTV
jgi:glycosyltransferase involved in cell wall biosynthesis